MVSIKHQTCSDFQFGITIAGNLQSLGVHSHFCGRCSPLQAQLGSTENTAATACWKELLRSVTQPNDAAYIGADLDSLLRDRAYEEHRPTLTAFHQRFSNVEPLVS
ncbi:hypothetical protein M433DRAFT_466112 [Acidomyces richmondensis BFW]|nr:hypothetical protein M433DRAFT_466112 [Acidomyces richmondensis BFW]